MVLSFGQGRSTDTDEILAEPAMVTPVDPDDQRRLVFLNPSTHDICTAKRWPTLASSAGDEAHMRRAHRDFDR